MNGDWGLGIGDWGLGPIPNPQSPNPQSPIPNPQSPIPNPQSPLSFTLIMLLRYFILIFSRLSITLPKNSVTARLAQLVERKALNLVVVGSSPTVGVTGNSFLCFVIIINSIYWIKLYIYLCFVI